MKAILAATDFTKSSINAVNYAAQMAIASGTKLVLIHATHIPIVSDSFFDLTTTLDELRAIDQEQMNELNNKLKAKYGDQLKLEKQVKIGFTTELIREFAKKNDIQLVVLGISHLDQFSQIVFGSTSTHLTGQLNCPILIIPEGKKFRPWKRMAFAFDQKPVSTGTGIRIIRDWAKLFDSTIHYVNVMDDNFPKKDDKSLSSVYKLFNETEPRLHFLNPVKGKTTTVIADWVSRHKVGALIMISREHNLLWRLLKERTTKKMAFETKVPLLIIGEKKQ
jgi:nucleotide-binding universal stress UspA family protein